MTPENPTTNPGNTRRVSPGCAPVTAAVSTNHPEPDEWDAMIREGDVGVVPTRRSRYRRTFLESPVWRQVRAARLRQDKECCQGCGFRSTHNDAHHLFYPLDWNATKVEDLRTLCRDCHNIVEALTHPASVHSRAEGLRRWKIAVEKIASFREWRAKLLRPAVRGPS